MDLISEREAARRFTGMGLSLSAGQHLLATGIAGSPQRTRSTTLYKAAEVDAVAARPAVTDEDFEAAFPLGVAVVRLPRGRTISATADWPETADLLGGPWRVGNGDAFAMTGSVAFGDGLPLVLSVSGFMLAGAWITAVLGGGCEDTAGVRSSWWAGGRVPPDRDSPGPDQRGITTAACCSCRR